MPITRQEMRDHLVSKGCKVDDTGFAYNMKYQGRDLRVIFKPRVFNIQENTIGKDGYYRFKRIASGEWKRSSIKDGKIFGLDRKI